MSAVSAGAAREDLITSLDLLRAERPDRDLMEYLQWNDGWHERENWGIWARAQTAVIRLPNGVQTAEAIKLEICAPVSPANPSFECQIYFGTFLGNYRFSLADSKLLVSIPMQSERLIVIRSAYLISPQAVDPGAADSRGLGVGLVHVSAGSLA
jgi:hypothetical protein